MEKLIKKIVEEAIPLDPKCEQKRSEELARRAKLRLDIEGLVRSLNHTKPGPTQTK